MKAFCTRGFVSLLLSVSFLIVVTSGLVLWIAEPPLWGLDKGAWKHMHIFVSLLMIVAGVVHLCLNWSVFRRYLWQKTVGFHQKREVALALIIPAAIMWLAISSGNGDMARMAAMTLPQLAERTGKPVDELVAALKKEGLTVDDPSHSLLEIAKDNDVHPGVVIGVVGKRKDPGPH